MKSIQEQIQFRKSAQGGCIQWRERSYVVAEILDTSARATQPMRSKDKTWVISFNGCIYNFMDLRLELQAKGHLFVSNSDTEVIVEGLAAYGPEFFTRLNGMFAVAAWNCSTRQLWLSRDRYGCKPLYYSLRDGLFLFSSEIKSLRAHSRFITNLNTTALNDYFTFQNNLSDYTLFANVQMLGPASTGTISILSSSFVSTTWWDYTFSDSSMEFEEAKMETERLLARAVARQMVADVPVGSYLSGGLDSGSIATLASGHVRRLTTFTAGFEMSEVYGPEAGYDERTDAELVANSIKSEHFEQVINAGDLHWSLPRVVWHLEDLRLGMSYPNFYISRLASKFVKVCLQGTGGDELYGGYPWRYYRVFNSLDKHSFFESYYEFWQRLVSDVQKPELFRPNLHKSMDLELPRTSFERVFEFNQSLRYETAEDHINNSLYFEAKTFLPALLMIGDKLSMANGLEERFPFMDNELVDLAQRIPVRHKLGNLENMKRLDENALGNLRRYQTYDDGKNVLREAMRDIIPARIVNRKKQGFSAPDESWYRGENAEYVRELLLNKDLACAEFINPDFVAKTVGDHIGKRHNRRLLLWSLMCFEWWCRIFLRNEKPYEDEPLRRQ